MFKFFMFCSFLFLTSCRVGENFAEPNFLADATVQQTLKLSSPPDGIYNTWPDIFNDNDLNTLLKFAYNNNLGIKQGQERLQQSRYAYLIGSKQNFPLFNLSGDYDFSKANGSHNNLLNSNTFKVGFDASWELDIWGKGEYVSEQYLSLMNNAQYSLSNLYVSLTAEVIQNYINLQKTFALRNITQQNLRLQKEVLQVVKDKYSAGIADDLALSQAKYSVEQTKALLPPLNTQIESYVNALAVLLGVVPENIPVDIEKIGKNIVSTPFKYSVTKLYQLPLSIIRSRPDVMAASALVQSKNATLNEAITNLYPNISLEASFVYIGSSGKSLFMPDNQVLSYTPSLLQPIWHWQQLKNNVELQRHIKEEYLLQYNEIMLTALLELKNAIYAVKRAYQTNQHLGFAADDMQRIFNLTYEKYKNGLVDFTDVALAQQNLLTAQNNLITSNADILLSFVAFYKATGGGYNVK